MEDEIEQFKEVVEKIYSKEFVHCHVQTDSRENVIRNDVSIQTKRRKMKNQSIQV